LACVAGGRAISGDKEEATTAIDKFYRAARDAKIQEDDWFEMRYKIIISVYRHRFGTYVPPTFIEVPKIQ